MRTAILMMPGGGKLNILPSNGKKFSRDEMVDIIEGDFVIIPINKRDALIHYRKEEDYSAACNNLATLAAKIANAIPDNVYLWGNAVICPTKMLPE